MFHFIQKHRQTDIRLLSYINMPVIKIHFGSPGYHIQGSEIQNSLWGIQPFPTCFPVGVCLPVWVPVWLRGYMWTSQDNLGTQALPSTMFKTPFSVVCHCVHPASPWDSISTSHLTMGLLELQVCMVLYSFTWVLGIQTKVLMAKPIVPSVSHSHGFL